MAYADVTVVVDGAVEEEHVFTDYIRLGEFLASITREAAGDGAPTEVFVLEHDHSRNVTECVCGQYILDHAPRLSLNVAAA